MKIFFYLTLFFLFVINCCANKLYFNNGKALEAEILEANETHVLLERSSDLQQFRIKTELLTKDSQKQIELYHSEGRYSSIPTLKTPLDSKTLNQYSGYIDSLIDQNLRSKRIQKTKDLDEHSYVRRLYLTTIGRIPTHQEVIDFTDDNNKDRKDKFGFTFRQAIFSGSKWTNSGVGVYAGSHDSYYAFAPFMDRIIE